MQIRNNMIAAEEIKWSKTKNRTWDLELKPKPPLRLTLQLPTNKLALDLDQVESQYPIHSNIIISMVTSENDANSLAPPSKAFVIPLRVLLKDKYNLRSEKDITFCHFSFSKFLHVLQSKPGCSKDRGTIKIRYLPPYSQQTLEVDDQYSFQNALSLLYTFSGTSGDIRMDAEINVNES
ncbi:hypothetical protein HYFRA_00004756 [Hymenoscyphus fraxineus]|uniref:Uncharacterized protein n=1 Tax=Hymenoscyphus fraxineus TaxID=746836 RepID=A0A9N9KKV8_9HELO|nr:hypothetical protein HYFRA_00004756 [Hymenoscyphus fraxineus]